MFRFVSSVHDGMKRNREDFAPLRWENSREEETCRDKHEEKRRTERYDRRGPNEPEAVSRDTVSSIVHRLDERSRSFFDANRTRTIANRAREQIMYRPRRKPREFRLFDARSPVHLANGWRFGDTGEEATPRMTERTKTSWPTNTLVLPVPA